MTRQAFDKLLAALSTDPGRAGESYEAHRRKLVKFFEWERCSTPEDNADETINRVAKRLLDGEVIHDLNRYFFGVAHLVLLEDLKLRKRQQTLKEELARNLPSPEAPVDETNAQCLEDCLSDLSAGNRDLILRYYEGQQRTRIQNREALAVELGIPINALRNRALRIRAKLEGCVARCTRDGAR